MFGFLKPPKYRAPDYALRTLPGPGTRNAAFEPGMENPLFSPVGTGIVSTYPWRITNRGDVVHKSEVYAGQTQGYATGAFSTGAPLLPEPISYNVPENLDLSGAAG